MHLTSRSSIIIPDTALRLARFFGVSEEFWMNLQTLMILSGQENVSKDLERIRPCDVVRE